MTSAERAGAPITFGDLFAGIGGFRLGLERAGMLCEWACEIDPYCRAVYAKHWPETMIYGDIRELRNPPHVDLLCGGFPCQDLSVAGKRAGITGQRSGLWSEFARLIGEVRPRYALVENVPGLLSAGLGRVLGDLAEIGYDAEWHCIPASAVGAPHRRDRVWIVAYSDSGRANVADANGIKPRPVTETIQTRQSESGGNGEMADAEAMFGSTIIGGESDGVLSTDVPNPAGAGLEGQESTRRTGGQPRLFAECDCWAVEPDVGRMAHGIPNRVDRLRALGNAVVPQVVEWIGRQIVEAEKRLRQEVLGV